ncbi:MAG: transposase [Oscillospiraceae bacterium]|nr:transposase [Oscillospiraceae bacterium]
MKDGHEMLWDGNSGVGARIARPLSDIGETIKTAIENIPKIYTNVAIDKYVIMPNHVHIIILLRNINDGRAMRAPTISTVVNQMKGYVTKEIGFSLWQKLYHDHIIRDETEYQHIWQYIDENPENWTEDCYFAKK